MEAHLDPQAASRATRARAKLPTAGLSTVERPRRQGSTSTVGPTTTTTSDTQLTVLLQIDETDNTEGAGIGGQGGARAPRLEE
jgi:hypothetical protein